MTLLKCTLVGAAITLGGLTLMLVAPPANLVWAGSDVDQLAKVKALIRAKGCGSCHEIAGINSADSRVGPALVDYAKHIYIAGLMPNNLENLTRWLLIPGKISPDTAMPAIPLTRQQAEAIAAYLLNND